jgi:2,5-furandicarboxylate decarboxylase 1
MSLRSYLKRLEDQNQIIRINRPVSKTYQAAGVLKKLEPSPVMFENLPEVGFRVAGNLFSSKAAFASYLGIRPAEIIPVLIHAIENRTPCPVVEDAPCQEVVRLEPDLDDLPVLRHCEGDGGNYISSGIFIARHPVHGTNVDFHRCMQFSKTEMAVRVVCSRHFDAFLQDLGQVDVAICVGNPPHVLAAAATSVELGVNELEIANA